jgi:hypothetical protein
MAARNNAAEKAASTTQANSLKSVIICPALYFAGERSSNSEATILPPFRSRPDEDKEKLTSRHVRQTWSWLQDLVPKIARGTEGGGELQ